MPDVEKSTTALRRQARMEHEEVHFDPEYYAVDTADDTCDAAQRMEYVLQLSTDDILSKRPALLALGRKKRMIHQIYLIST